ncbi:hypothetical protein H5410_016669 [Solanum commersonii]|uniref:ABC transmembrane type-1 domain-containing protein n=1 Tax=Solanum commersonii TaxID=4109 RepID=A0A9J5ZWW5_SOLCO|nr:hypothetical protein H5410_016669 [Solanum commersonii]
MYTVMGTLSLLFALSPQLAPILGLLILAVSILVALFKRSTVNVFQAHGLVQASIADSVTESFSAIRTVRSFSGEKRQMSVFARQVLEFESSSIKIGTFKSFHESVTRVAIYISLMALYCLGGSKVKAGELSVGIMASFIGYTFTLTFAVQGLVNTFGDLRAALAATERINAVLSDAEIDEALACSLEKDMKQQNDETLELYLVNDSDEKKQSTKTRYMSTLKFGSSVRNLAETGDICLEVRRWRYKDQAAEFFGTRKYNAHGRYMNILSLKGEDKSVIIVPELDINAGWRSVAFKIQSFIKCIPQKELKIKPQKCDINVSFAKVVEGSNWQNSKYEAPTSKDKKTESEVIVKSREQGLLGRCIIGFFDKNNAERPSLSDVRQWSTTVWKKAFGVNIYEMLGGHYLFEFPNRYMAEQILQGEWIWKRNKIKLEWWNPYVGCEPTTYKPKSTWIRVMGLPMHLWTNETFKEIGELCGGWLMTEEETELRNHLKWARIEIRGDGRSIPSEVSISRDGTKFIIPIWAERKTLFEFLSESNRTTTREDQLKIQWIIDPQPSISEKAEVQIFKNKDLDSRSTGPDKATIIFNNFSPQPNSDLQEVVIDESLENYSNRDVTGRKTPNLQNLEGTQPREEGFEEGKGAEISCLPINEVNACIILGETFANENESQQKHLEMFNSGEIWDVQEIEPLRTQVLTDSERRATTWVQQNLLKLHKMFGVDFQGLEEEALELLKQVDASRHARRMEQTIEVKGAKHKGAQELKNLITFDVKFKSNGDRRKGKGKSHNTP